jgi:hypothetical protein
MIPVIIRAGNFWDGVAQKLLGPLEILIVEDTMAGIGRFCRV